MGYNNLRANIIPRLVSQGRAKPIIYSKLILPLLVIIYLIIIIFASYYHAVWRDEVRALSIVIESPSLKVLFANLHNEGHPCLWYLILYDSYAILPSFLVLKIASISIATLCIGLFIYKSPFTLLQKSLFIFGYLPIYEYSVICRSYGLSMLLLFSFCILYPLRYKRFLLLSLILFLLSQTNVHSLIIVISIYISLILEFILERKQMVSVFENKYIFMVGLTLITIGIITSIIQIYPDSSSVVFRGFPSPYIVVKSLILSTILPGYKSSILWWNNYSRFLFNMNTIIRIIIGIPIWLTLWFLYIILFREPFILIIILLSVVGLGMFGELIYPFQIYHKGFFLLLVIMALWLDGLETSEVKDYPPKLNGVISFLLSYKGWFITLLFLSQAVIGFYAVIQGVDTHFSSSKQVGVWLNNDYKLKKAIIIGEPEYLIESLPYYVKNPIYKPRENRFGKTVSFTKNNKSDYSLAELLNTAIRLKSEFKKPILIFLGNRLTPEGPYHLNFFYGTGFDYDRGSLEKFNEDTMRIKSFQGAKTDENYDVFLLK